MWVGVGGGWGVRVKERCTHARARMHRCGLYCVWSIRRGQGCGVKCTRLALRRMHQLDGKDERRVLKNTSLVSKRRGAGQACPLRHASASKSCAGTRMACLPVPTLQGAGAPVQRSAPPQCSAVKLTTSGRLISLWPTHAASSSDTLSAQSVAGVVCGGWGWGRRERLCSADCAADARVHVHASTRAYTHAHTDFKSTHRITYNTLHNDNANTPDRPLEPPRLLGLAVRGGAGGAALGGLARPLPLGWPLLLVSRLLPPFAAGTGRECDGGVQIRQCRR